MSRTVLCAAAVALCLASVSAAAPFCNGLNCPPFTSVCNSSAGYEVRKYPTSIWSAINVDAASPTKGASDGFQALFDYISGANAAKKKIPMTAPVLLSIDYTASHPVVPNATHFYMPYNYQGKPLSELPQPTGKGVYLYQLPAITTAVKSYGGYSNDEDVEKNANELRQALSSKGQVFEEEVLLVAGYDSPFRFYDRTNEVMVLLSGDNYVC